MHAKMTRVMHLSVSKAYHGASNFVYFRLWMTMHRICWLYHIRRATSMFIPSAFFCCCCPSPSASDHLIHRRPRGYSYPLFIIPIQCSFQAFKILSIQPVWMSDCDDCEIRATLCFAYLNYLFTFFSF